MTYPGPQTDAYTYDANGNRLSKNSTSYFYDNADQLYNAGGVSYTYDANGNLTGRGADAFTWDHENRLKSATIGGVTTTYAYNGDGLRMSRITGGVTTSYTWDVAAKVPVVLQDGTNTYVYGLGLISMTDGSGNQTYRLTDGLGSTVNLTDGAGNVTGSYTYDVFGAVRTHTGASTEYSFTGEQNDPNGLEYLRARYYDNATGRFLVRDPLGMGYAYVSNNPANRIDPTGLYEICTDDVQYGHVCFDSTEVHLPADPPIGHVGNACIWASGEIWACDGNKRIDPIDEETASGVVFQMRSALLHPSSQMDRIASAAAVFLVCDRAGWLNTLSHLASPLLHLPSGVIQAGVCAGFGVGAYFGIPGLTGLFR